MTTPESIQKRAKEAAFEIGQLVHPAAALEYFEDIVIAALTAQHAESAAELQKAHDALKLQSDNYAKLAAAIQGDTVTSDFTDPCEAATSLRSALQTAREDAKAGWDAVVQYKDERDKAREEVERLTKQLAEHRELLQALLGGTVEGENLLRDREMLDWLQSNNCYWIEIQSEPHGEFVYRDHPEERNLREAITAAMQKGQQQ